MIMNKRACVRPLLAVALVVTGLASSSAQNQPAVTDVPRLEFEKYTLPNGLEVILSQKRGLPMVAVNLWYHVGPANEAAGRTGFAHLFEHMMFQSSKHVPADSHIRLLEAAGASDLNGTTDFDRTNYFETVPANQLELALWLESDRMGYLLEKVDQAALTNQQDVVRNERRQSVENQPYGLAEEALVQAVYPKGHPYYGYVIGSHEDIQAARLDDVQRFFRQYYAPNNATMAIVGDFEPAEAKKLVEKYFGTLKRGPAVPAPKAEPVRIAAERRLTVPSRVELPRVYMAWLTPAIFKPGDADADIAATILGGGRSSRLYKKLVYERQIAQNVSASQQSLTLGSMFQIEATARPGRTAEELEKAIDEELAALRMQAPPLRDVEMARNTIETNIIGGLERLGGFGGIADRLNSYNHYLGTPDFLQKDIQRYRAVTPAAVQAFAREHLAPSARVVLHAVPGQPPATAAPPRRCRGDRAERAGRRRGDQRRGAVASADAEAGPLAPARALHARERHAVERPHADPEPARRRADHRRQPRAEDGKRRQPVDQAGARQLRGGDARRGNGDAQRAAARRRDRAARRLAHDQQLDGCDDGVGTFAGEELPGDAEPAGRHLARPGVPGRRDRAPARSAARSTGAAAGQPGRRRRPGRRGGAVR